MSAPLVELVGASLHVKAWPWSPPRTLLADVDLSLRAGERVAVIGPSGGGKSTLARLLTGIARSATGARRGPGPGGVQLLPQDPLALLHPLVPIGRAIDESAGGTPGHAEELLRLLGLTHRRAALPHDLSGGEQRRAALARVLAARPSVLVADEPTEGLDAHLRAGVLDLLLTLTPPDRALVCITHDVDLIAGRFNRLIGVIGGRVVEDSPIEGAPRPHHPALRALLAAAGA